MADISQVSGTATAPAPNTVPTGDIRNQLPVSTTGSAVLGTSRPVSVLGAFAGDDASSLFGNLSSTQSALFQQVQANASARLQEILQRINDSASQSSQAINVQNDRWISVKAQINNAQIAVTNGQESAGRVGDTLLEMRTSIANTGEPGEDPKYWKDQYDGQVNKINIEAESGTVASSLVGFLNPVDLSPNQIQYRSDTSLGQTTLTGTYIGSQFRIKADDGTYWVPDPTTDIIQAYAGLQGEAQKYTTTDGQTISKATSTRNGLKLISYNQTTKKITLQVSVVPTDPPIVVTGTLDRVGIGVMQSWFYNNFATKADRTHAFADISKAEVNLVSAQADLQRSATQTGQDQKRADAALNALTQQTIKVNQDQQNATHEAQVTAAQQYLAMQANLQNLQSVQSNYLNAFAGFIDDPFAQASLDLIA